MAITAVFQPNPTPYSVTVIATHDGAAGDDLTIANATILAALVSQGPLRRLFSRTYDKQGDARAAILEGEVASIGGDQDSHGIDVYIMPRDIVASRWAVDVDVDGNLLPRLIILGLAGQGASTCLYRLEFRHSITR